MGQAFRRFVGTNELVHLALKLEVFDTQNDGSGEHVFVAECQLREAIGNTLWREKRCGCVRHFFACEVRVMDEHKRVSWPQFKGCGRWWIRWLGATDRTREQVVRKVDGLPRMERAVVLAQRVRRRP